MRKLFAVFSIVLAGILSMQADKTVRFDFQTSEARTMDVYPTAYVHPLVAEVVVDTKTGRIHDTWTLSVNDFISRQDPDNYDATLQNLRAYGLFKSSEKHGCDLIVAAMFDIKISDQGVVITLVGYPANFANWASVTSADYNWIDVERGRKNVQIEDKPSDPKKK